MAALAPSASTDRRTPERGSFLSDGLRLRYESYGEGDTVLVYLHGLLLDANFNRGLAQRLAVKGRRVVLLDLPGHGRSDKPRHASAHRMDSYARHVVAALDHLGLDQAIVGGVSLGANVALLTAALAPDRVQGLVLEMPVLEWAVPGAALVFLPMLLGVHYARRAVSVIGAAARHAPRTGNWALEGLRSSLSHHPDETAAVLHGMLVGPIAPTVEARRALGMPALVIGHKADFVHPFTDASNLVRLMPSARLVQARSIVELRMRPARLLGEIGAFLDETSSASALERIGATGRVRQP